MDIQGYEEKLKTLKKMYPNYIIHKILVFGVPSEDALVGTKNIIPVLSSKIATVTSLGTVMCDITTDFLAELAVLSIARQIGSFKSPSMKELELPATAANKINHSVSFKAAHSHSRSNSGLASPTGSFSGVGRLNTSKTGSISLGLSDKAKNRQKGRSLKFLASMYLIAGRWQDALSNFTEAATILKNAHDHLWYASSLEGIGICLVLLSFLEVPVSIPSIALSSTHSSHTPEPSSDVLSPSSSHSSTSGPMSTAPPPMFEFLPELTSNILTSFARSQATPEDSVQQIVYCETILRLANLLAITRLAGGWNPASLNAIVRGHSVTKNVTADSPSISAITGWCNKAYATNLGNMNTICQANVYCGMAAIYSNIGLVRKRTFILRDLLVNIAPNLMKHKLKQATSSEIHANGFSDKKFVTTFDGKDSQVLELLDSLCSVYGAGDITSVGYGWSHLRVSFLRVALSLCESLPDFVGTVHYASLLLSTSADVLSSDEQLRIFNTILSATESARTLGQGQMLAQYWDPNLLRDVKMVQVTTSISPQFVNQSAATASDVFIHNPYADKRGSMETAGTSQGKKTEPIMVENERTDFTIKLQNPFAFELHVYELTLLTENIEVKAAVKDIYIAPRTLHEVSIPVVPLGVGKLIIRGCRIHVAGCEPKDFELVTKRDFLQESKLKVIGVEAAVGKGEKERQAALLKRQIDLQVIAAQPVLVLNSLSLTQSWVMLLEGENQTFTFTVANISDIEVNNLNLKFSDSTTQPLQMALNNKVLPLNEIYEVEFFLYHRKALKWKKSDQKVLPQRESTYEINILGKRGMTDCVIQVDYSHQPDQPVGQGHWFRSLSIPINVTVNSSIELGSCDMIPLQHNQIFADNPENHELSLYFDKLKARGELFDYCILVIDLRNAWTETIEVALWSSPEPENENSKDKFEIKATINSGHTKRLLIPVKRVEFSLEDLERPIPNLSKRQFVLDSQTSPERLRAIRENFWYRDALLKMLGGTWRVTEGLPRSGELELRGIRLSQKMINVLQVELVRIKMIATLDVGSGEDAPAQDKSEPSKLSPTFFSAKAERDFVTISTTITNNTKYPLSGILRIIPSERYISAEGPNSGHGQWSSRWENIENQLIINGVLQQPIINIPPGESLVVKTGTVFLSRGEYEWTSILEETKGAGKLKQHTQRDPIFVKAH